MIAEVIMKAANPKLNVYEPRTRVTVESQKIIASSPVANPAVGFAIPTT